MCKKFPPRFQNSSKGLVEMGYIPPAFLAWVEIVGGIFPLKIPPSLKYFTIWWNFVCGGKKFHHTNSTKQPNTGKGLSSFLFGYMGIWESVLREILPYSPHIFAFLLFIYGNFIYGYMALLV